ncbi:hypothetical protein H0H92_003351 [Tricholoma furcatifolium]|nr:hypothetical protein H0H92_003351 [Tricholoma furcatifolium]
MASFNLKSIFKAIFRPSPNSPQSSVIVTRTRSITSVTSSVATDNPRSSGTSTSRGDLALEAAVPILGLIGAVANGIPVASGPLKAVVNSLLVILDGFDVSKITSITDNDSLGSTPQKNRRNKNDILSLRMRLERQLADTERKLREAMNMRKIRFRAVAELIEGCCKDIDHYIEEYQLATTLLMQSSMTLVIHLVDAMGHTHPIPISMTNAFEQFIQALKALYVRASDRGAVHHRYLQCNQFHLGIDDSRKVINIKNDNDLRELVQPGTTVVMSIVVAQAYVQYDTCPACLAYYMIDENYPHIVCGYTSIEHKLGKEEAEDKTYPKPSQDDLEKIVNIHVELYPVVGGFSPKN